MYERYWLVAFWHNGFEGKLIIYGTEQDLWDYLGTELRDNYSYHGASPEEVEAGKILGMKFYICPKTHH